MILEKTTVLVKQATEIVSLVCFPPKMQVYVQETLDKKNKIIMFYQELIPSTFALDQIHLSEFIL